MDDIGKLPLPDELRNKHMRRDVLGDFYDWETEPEDDTPLPPTIMHHPPGGPMDW